MKLAGLSLLFGASLLLVGVSICNIVYTWRGSDVLKLARIIETRNTSGSEDIGDNKALGSDYFAQLERDNAIDDLSKLCVDDISRSTLTVRLASLESALPSASPDATSKRVLSVREPHHSGNSAPPSAISGVFDALTAKRTQTQPAKSTDPTELDRRIALARRSTSQRLVCAPTDGNAWLQMARLLVAFSSDKQGSTTAIQMSYWLAPLEKWVIDQRFAFVAQSIEAGDPTLAVEFLIDVRRMVKNFPVGEIAALYVDAGQKARSALASEVHRLPQRRQEQIISAIGHLGVTMR